MGDLFFKYFKFTLYVYKISGVENFYTVSPLKNVTNVLWNLPLLLLFFFSVWKLHSKDVKDDFVMTDTNQLVVFSAALHTVCRILYSRRKNVPDLLKEIDGINKDLKIEIRHMKRRWVILCSGIIIYIGYVLVYVPYGNGQKDSFYFDLTLSTSSCASFAEVYFVYQIIKLICGQFQDINIKLYNNYNRISSESEYGPMVNATKVTKKKEIDEIVNIVSNHYRITKVSKFSNSTFNVHVLSACVSSFIVLTSAIHYSLSVIFIGLRNGEENRVLISTLLTMGLWITSYSFLFIFIIKPWRDLHNDAKKTATYIHDIWNRYANANAVDANINHLQLISLQLLNTKLEFTAFGFFSLDWTLLHAIISAVSTYVVILIQFETS